MVIVPLTTLVNDLGATEVAFAARMLYWPEQVDGSGLVDWAQPHEYRVLWLVQMIMDECISPDDDPDTCSRQDTLNIIHVYHESWTLTGLSIRADHGMNVGIRYEAPLQNSDN